MLGGDFVELIVEFVLLLFHFFEIGTKVGNFLPVRQEQSGPGIHLRRLDTFVCLFICVNINETCLRKTETCCSISEFHRVILFSNSAQERSLLFFGADFTTGEEVAAAAKSEDVPAVVVAAAVVVVVAGFDKNVVA